MLPLKYTLGNNAECPIEVRERLGGWRPPYNSHFHFHRCATASRQWNLVRVDRSADREHSRTRASAELASNANLTAIRMLSNTATRLHLVVAGSTASY